MKIVDLAKSLNIECKVLIDYLKKNDFQVKSHMQKATDEMIEMATKYFEELQKSTNTKAVAETTKIDEEKENKVQTYISTGKKYDPTELIPCKSVTPCELVLVGVDKTTVYHWNHFGDVDYVTYRDLQSWRRNESIVAPLILIEDPELCYQWRNDLKNAYENYLGIEYPEEFFELPDDVFADKLRRANPTFKDVIKITAVNMINNTNYPSIQKLTIIDDILGTCIKDFI